MSPIFFALLSAFVNALCKTLYRYIIKAQTDPWVILLINYIFASAFLALFRGVPSLAELSPITLSILGLSGILWAAATYYDLKAHEHLDVSLSGIFGTLRYAFLVVACVFIFDETLTTHGIVGIALIAVSTLISSDFRSATFRKGSSYRLLAIVLINLGTLNDKGLSKHIPVDLIVFSSFLLPGLIYSIIKPKKLLSIPQQVKKTLGLILLAPIFNLIIYFCYVTSFAHGQLVLTATIGQTTVIFSFILGILVLGERTHLLRRGISSLLCLVGAFLVSYR